MVDTKILDPDAASRLAGLCGYSGVSSTTRLCGLWAGMGSIYEIRCKHAPGSGGDGGGGGAEAIIVKQIECSAELHSIGDRRKRASYICEANFYSTGVAAQLLAAGCRVPRPLHVSKSEDGCRVTICMSKLVGASAGRVGMAESKAVLEWLATLHAIFFGHQRADAAVARGLQPQGTYWYLDTRPDEHAAMPQHGWEGRLRLAARALDMRLKQDAFVSIVHGDLKDANLIMGCNDDDREISNRRVPLVYDFQYCGKGCIGKDLAYFLTCGSDVDAALEPELLAHYHQSLTQQLQLHHSGDDSKSDHEMLPSLGELNTLLQLCICDLGRWMSGWGWWGKNRDSEIINVLDKLDNGKILATEDDYVRAMGQVFPVL